MERIMIIGGNGAGKTTFARLLSTKLNIPLIHLDKFGFVKKSAVDKLTKLILGDTPVDLPQVHLEYFSAYATLLFEVFCIRYTKGGSPCGFDV